MLEAAATEHAGRLATVTDPGAVSQAGADAAHPAEFIKAGGGQSAGQLDGSGGVLSDKALMRNHRDQFMMKGYHMRHLNSVSTFSLFSMSPTFLFCDWPIVFEPVEPPSPVCSSCLSVCCRGFLNEPTALTLNCYLLTST